MFEQKLFRLPIEGSYRTHACSGRFGSIGSLLVNSGGFSSAMPSVENITKLDAMFELPDRQELNPSQSANPSLAGVQLLSPDIVVGDW